MISSLITILALLILLSAFFSAAEIGMMSLNRYRLRYLVKKKNKRAIRVNKLLNRPDKLLSVVLIGNTVANILASMIATLIGQSLYQDAGVAIATIILTFVVLVFAEMAPKTLAALYPQEIAFNCARLLQFFQWLFLPIIYCITKIVHGLLFLFNISMHKTNREDLSGDELRSVVHEAGALLPVEHKSMVISLLDLERATVEDIMIPKNEIIGINLSQPWHEVLDQLETAQHTRLPVYRDTIDNLIGIVHARSILNLALEENFTLENLLKIIDKPYFVPEATTLNIQILNFQKVKQRSCFVVNEYGELQGLVTIEDILEEVVGEFTTDIANLSKNLLPQADGSIIIDASITVRHLNRLLGWQLPFLGPRTLSGLIIEHLGYIPPANCCLKLNNFKIEILKIGKNTIKTVRVIVK